MPAKFDFLGGHLKLEAMKSLICGGMALCLMAGWSIGAEPAPPADYWSVEDAKARENLPLYTVILKT
jgi:hypothetical protein